MSSIRKTRIPRVPTLSIRSLVLIYSLGALLTLILAFLPGIFSPGVAQLRSIHCLILSWILAIGAVMLSKYEAYEFHDAVAECCRKNSRD